MEVQGKHAGCFHLPFFSLGYCAGLVGVELILHVVASMGLWFGPVLRAALVVVESGPFLLLLLPHQRVG